ncbi:MAG: hypothetical protein LUG16_02240 [Candidatus Gastranaerophilales bacterium]|nr:hypothetical protein [Candidatus Gastranaerophilales bacterium]
MKKYLTAIFIIIAFCIEQKVYAESTIPVSNAIKSGISAGDFSKSYKTSSENLLYLLLSAISENNYLIEEIQFKTGSVLFKAYTKEFIASVSEQDGVNSFVKIIPADNNYNFSPSLIEKLHTYIESNNKINFQKIL